MEAFALAIKKRHSVLEKALLAIFLLALSLGNLWPLKGDDFDTIPAVRRYSQNELSEPYLRLMD